MLQRPHVRLQHGGAVQVDLCRQLPEQHPMQQRVLHGPYPRLLGCMRPTKLLRRVMRTAGGPLLGNRLLSECRVRDIHCHRDVLCSSLHGARAVQQRVLRPASEHGRARVLPHDVLQLGFLLLSFAS